MKHFTILLTVMVLAFTMQAQYIYNDFDANQNEPFSGWPNNPAVVANPDQSGINTSAGVAEWVRSSEMWAHTYCELPGKIDFSTGTVFEVKVHVPVACTVLFKLEDKNNGSVSTELSSDVSTTNEWVQLSFDFSGAQSGLYDKIVVFYDFANPVDNTYYFDDVTGPEYGGGSSGNQVDLPVTFDDDNVIYALVDFGGNSSEIIVDPTDESNHVAETTKTEGAETWAGTTVGGTSGFENPVPFEPGSTIISVDVWSPVAGIPVRLKVEDSGDPTISVETEATTTVANEWESLQFDFSNEAEGTAEINFSYNYNKASIFFDFGTNGNGATYYWDNMVFGLPTQINEINYSSISVYPNPASDVLYLDRSIEYKNIQVYSANGQLVFSSDININAIDLKNFESGLYTLKASGIDGNHYFSKFLIK